MQPHQYPQQSWTESSPWTESSHPGTQAQTPQPAKFQRPVAERQVAETQPQQPQLQRATGATEPTATGHPTDLQFQAPPALQPQQLQPQQLQPQQLQPQQFQPQQLQPQQLQPQSPQRFSSEQVPQQRAPAVQYPVIQQPASQLASTGPVARTGEGQTAGKSLTAGQTQAPGAAGTEQAMAGASSAQAVTQPEQQAEAARLKRGVPSVDVHETPDDIVVYADVPGCTPDDVELLANENSITLVAKRVDPSLKNAKTIQRERVDEVERTIPLSVSADVEEAEATVENGVCRITLPKNEEERKKRIGIQ